MWPPWMRMPPSPLKPGSCWSSVTEAPYWYGIPFCSCLAGMAIPFWLSLASVASSYAHALLVKHPLLVMPCLASPFSHALLVWHLPPLMPCLAYFFAHTLLVWKVLLLMPCWLDISLRSRHVDLAPPLLMPCWYGHPLLFMPCWCGIFCHSCLAGLAALSHSSLAAC